MAGSLTEFGARCREHRINHRATMLEQATKLGCSIPLISAIELGEQRPPEDYAEAFADWLSLSALEKSELSRMAAAKSNVLRYRPKDGQAARKLFRKINTLTPMEIRRLGKAPQRIPPDDRRRIR